MPSNYPATSTPGGPTYSPELPPNSGYPATSTPGGPTSNNPYSPTTGSSDSSGGTGTAEIQSFNVSGLPFRFNPPMHKLSRMVLTDLGEGKRYPGNSLAAFYDETNNTYKSDFAVRTGNSKTKFENLRLGRIIMDDMAVSAGIVEAGKRYGFRFLYNPSQISGGLNVSANFIPDQRATNTAVLQSGLETISFEVLLNRIPDVNSKATTSDYLPRISSDDLKRIQEQGTQYDVDFLYRCANGIHDTQSRKRTGDIGVLLPNPCRLILGPFTSRGAVVGVSVTDQMFAGSMVPILSYVQITFARFLSTNTSDLERLQSLGISQEGSGSGSDSGGSSVTPPSGKTLSGKSVWDLAKGAGFSSSEADTMTRIANKESGWRTNAFNGNASSGDESYGLWQINMLGSLGPDRRRRLGITRNDELFDPVTNARAARMIYKSQGYSAWSVYKNGSYRSVPISWR